MARNGTDGNGEDPPGGDDAFEASLRAALGREPAVIADPALGWSRLRQAIERDAAGERRSWPWKAAAAVLLAVTLGQGAWIVSHGPDRFELASSDARTPDGPFLQVAFRPDASEADMRALLTGLEAEIVAGPSALGLYRVAVADAVATRDAFAASPIVASVAAP